MWPLLKTLLQLICISLHNVHIVMWFCRDFVKQLHNSKEILTCVQFCLVDIKYFIYALFHLNFLLTSNISPNAYTSVENLTSVTLCYLIIQIDHVVAEIAHTHFLAGPQIRGLWFKA